MHSIIINVFLFVIFSQSFGNHTNNAKESFDNREFILGSSNFTSFHNATTTSEISVDDKRKGAEVETDEQENEKSLSASEQKAGSLEVTSETAEVIKTDEQDKEKLYDFANQWKGLDLEISGQRSAAREKEYNLDEQSDLKDQSFQNRTTTDNKLQSDVPEVPQNITEASTTERTIEPFSASPYLGSVIEEVVEEPWAKQGDDFLINNFKPLNIQNLYLRSNYKQGDFAARPPNLKFQSKSSEQEQVENHLSRPMNFIEEDFENTNFNENPFGRVKFPDEKSKYFPIYLTENELETQDRPLKFDDNDQRKQNSSFPYKIETLQMSSVDDGFREKSSLSTPASDVFRNNLQRHSHNNNYHKDIMKNVANITLPLEMRKKHPLMRYYNWKKFAHTIMAFLPVGLLMAAIPPKVIKANATSYSGRENPQATVQPISRFFKKDNSRRSQ